MNDKLQIMIARIETGLDRAGRNPKNLNLLVKNLRAEIDKSCGTKRESWSDEYRLYLMDVYARALEACVSRAAEAEEFEQAAVLKKELDSLKEPEKKLEKISQEIF